MLTRRILLAFLLISMPFLWSGFGDVTKSPQHLLKKTERAEEKNLEKQTLSKGIHADQYSEEKADKNAPQTLRLMFAGDIMSQLSQIEAAEIGGGRHDYTPCFQYIKPILETADLAIGNLECTLLGKPPYTGYPNFKSPEQLANALKINGFDVLVTSNNHALDSGLDGLKNTISTVRREGFMQTGTFADGDRKRLLYPLLIYKNGFKIALLNYTHHTNGYRTPEPAVVNRLDLEQIHRDILAARALKPDCIITCVHWGIEYEMNEDANQREIAHRLHWWGSDLVIGAHPHVTQPIKNETFTNNDKSYSILAAYSLGNFISAQPFPNTEGGVVFEVNLKKAGNKVSIEDYHYIPVVRYTPKEDGKMRFFALPVSPFESENNVLKMPSDERLKTTKFVQRVRKQMDIHGITEHRFSVEDLNSAGTK